MKLIKACLLLFMFPVTCWSAGLADYAENMSVDALLRGTTYSSTTPTNYYIALYSTACSDSAMGTELTGGSYARVSIARSQAAWTATQGGTGVASSGTNGTVTNAVAITFTTATADWPSATYWGIVDTASGAANQIICSALTAARTVTNGTTASFAPGALTVQIDN